MLLVDLAGSTYHRALRLESIPTPLAELSSSSSHANEEVPGSAAWHFVFCAAAAELLWGGVGDVTWGEDFCDEDGTGESSSPCIRVKSVQGFVVVVRRLGFNVKRRTIRLPLPPREPVGLDLSPSVRFLVWEAGTLAEP